MAAKTGPDVARPGHPRVVAALIVVATLIAFVGIFSIWINRQALNTDNWVNTSDKLLQNEEIQAQLSIFLSDQLFANVDVQTELEKALPPRLAPLAGPATGGLQQLAPQVAQKALARPRIQSLWSTANRAAHEALLKVLNGGGPAVSTGGGEVTLDLGALVEQIGAQLGVGGNIASKLPADAGEMTILESSQLSTAQSIARLIRRAPVVLTLLVLLLYGLAIYLAGGRRREALRSVGFSLLVAGVVVLIVRGLAGNSIVDGLVGSASVKPAAEAVWEIGTSLLVTVAASAITLGILLVVGAWLAGPTRPAVALRREASPYVREQRAWSYAVAGVVYLALIAWAPIAAFHKPLGILLFAVLFAAAAELLRRQILREFPDTPAGQLGERLRSMWAARGGRRAAHAAEADTRVGELERLASLHDSGALSDEEFAAAKAETLRTT